MLFGVSGGERMAAHQLSETEYLATFVEPMRNISAIAVRQGDDGPGVEGGVLDLWPYVSSVPESDTAGHSVRSPRVDGVCRSGDDRWDHVMVATGTKNVHLVVVVDLAVDQVYGHHLLDLNEKYGVAPEPRHAKPIVAVDPAFGRKCPCESQLCWQRSLVDRLLPVESGYSSFTATAI